LDAAYSPVTAVEQVTDKEWIVNDALSQIAVVEEPSEEEGAAEDAKIIVVQEPNQLQKVCSKRLLPFVTVEKVYDKD
jgi:hypothetical protein